MLVFVGDAGGGRKVAYLMVVLVDAALTCVYPCSIARLLLFIYYGKAFGFVQYFHGDVIAVARKWLTLRCDC